MRVSEWNSHSLIHLSLPLYSINLNKFFYLSSFDNIDFDECLSTEYHDCSENSQCFNLRGTYTCSCKEGYADLSENSVYPGRVCSAEIIGCEKCHYHGTCFARDDNHVICECFQWYTGVNCHINLKGKFYLHLSMEHHLNY